MTAPADGFSLDEIVARLGGQRIGEGGRRVRRVATLEHAGAEQISFLANPKYRSQLKTTRAAAVILAPADAPECPIDCIVADDPYVYYARVAQLLHPPAEIAGGIHPHAQVDCELPPGVQVGSGAVIGRNARIGEGSVIGPGCFVGEGVSIGAGSRLHARVVIYAGCSLGERAVVHAGAVIGADGFGFAREQGAWLKIPQIGRVRIGDDVEIGANTTIDRGAIEDTIIEDGVKLDNQIQIGHNVRIGAHTAMAGCVGVAGSTQIGRRCTFGGSAMILGHLSIADDVNISAATLVTKSIRKAGTYSGMLPFAEHRAWLRNSAHLRHLDELNEKIRRLEQRLAQLEKKP